MSTTLSVNSASTWISGYSRMNPCSVGIMRMPTSGRLTFKRPLGVDFDWENSTSILLISGKMRRQLSRKSSPSGVRVIARVLRWNSRTPRRSSSRDMVFPTAEDETLRRRPASVKLRASAARTKTPKALRLSIGDPAVLTSKSQAPYMYVHITYGSTLKLVPFAGAHRASKDVVDGLSAVVAVSLETCPPT